MANSDTKKIGLAVATIVGLNAMIGAGIFGTPIKTAQVVGPAAILTFIFVSIAIYFMADSIARVATLFPEEGSFYAYTQKWAGHKIGLIASGAYIFGLIIAMGALTRIACGEMQHYIPSLSVTILGIITLTLLIGLNAVGVVISEIGQYILLALTIFPLVTTILICLFNFDLNLATNFTPNGIFPIFKAASIPIFGYFGFECATSLFRIVKNPERNVPKAITMGVAIVGFVYVTLVTALIFAVPQNIFIQPGMTVSTALSLISPQNIYLVEAIRLCIIAVICGTINSMIWGVSNLLVSLVGKMKSTYARNLIKKNIFTQRTAVILFGITMFISFLTLKSIDLLMYTTSVCIVFAYISSMITLFTIKQEWTSGRNIKTILGIITALAIFIFAADGVIAEITKLL